ncbi:MAG: CHASE2 domain-containing protein [Paludibacteraceae bacterium]|jgi:CHASE2 domain-containing sensor protein|nr:CHASE2 domain-containing protein [Paludibacteraceae bacterium]MBQ8713811.1 CHASE2 domain-containing protein [Prevotella sp.]
MSRLWRYFIVTILAFFVVGIYVLAAFNLKVFNPVAEILDDYSFTDFYYKLLDGAGKRDTSRIVTIVDMTELRKRRDFAQLFMEVNALHPKAVGVDVVFEGYKDEDLEGDTLLAMTVQQLQNFVFSYKIIDSMEGETVHSFFSPNDSVNEGFTNMPRQLYGGMKRSVSIGRDVGGTVQPSFIKKVSEIYAGQEVIPLADKDLSINFSPKYYQIVSYDSLLENRDLIEDHLVLIGAMKEEGDMHYTPQGKIAGVELLAYAAETMLRQSEIKHASTGVTVVVSFIVVFLSVILLSLYKQFVSSKKTLFHVILSTSLIRGLFICGWLSLIVWVTFILFCRYNYSISLAIAMSAIALIYMAENLYDTFKTTIEFKRNKKNES